MIALFALAAAAAVAAMPAGQIYAIRPATYPPLDQVPPINATWTAKFMKGVPKLPRTGESGSPNPDFSLTKTKCVGNKVLGLTFDDGPSIPTPELLDELKKRKIKATFFVVGSRVISRPQVLQRAFKEGHQIGIHTWSHPHLTHLTNDQIVAEIIWTAKAIRESIGVTPAYVRPPYGDIDKRVAQILENMGMTIVNWEIDSQDSWGSAGPKDVKGVFHKYIQANPSVSPIALEHDLFDYQAKAAPPAIDMLIDAGYTVVPVNKCTGISKTYSNALWKGIFEFN